MWFPLRTAVGRCGKSLGSGASWSIMFKIQPPLSANNSLELCRKQKLEFYPTRVEVALCTVFRWSMPRIPQLSKKKKIMGQEFVLRASTLFLWRGIWVELQWTMQWKFRRNEIQMVEFSLARSREWLKSW